ncbi:MAG TPA: family 10 glycosylhydrolase [Chitinophagaceae bacterium]|nr:family 10 glycosylhydrolase [Chitinophagaceae bacterium]
MKRTILILLLLSLISGRGLAQARPEFRGVWIASVDNIDWPLPGQYDPEAQRAEFIRQLELHRANGMNAVIVQVRPSADAFYPSPYEPWSQWLTGKQGRPPHPYWDPLQFMVEEAHKRGFEFHAWLNPYRAEHGIGKASIAPSHVTRVHPDWFVTYGGKRYFDPGHKEGQQWVVNIVRDLVKRYDIDAVHMDDYFYPYKLPGREFPDNATFQKYGLGLSRDDWRRSNTDSIIVALHRAIREEKPWVKFGISPFGIWRNQSQDPEGSATRGGVSNYDDLYADILLWLRQGWIDYVAPQIYWEFSHSVAPFQLLVDWWNEHTYGRHCYIGLGVYRAGSNAAWRDPNQLPRQIRSLRAAENVQGAVYFSSKTFNHNPNGWNDSLRSHYYREPVPVPVMDWLPARPGVEQGVGN